MSFLLSFHQFKKNPFNSELSDNYYSENIGVYESLYAYYNILTSRFSCKPF